MYSIKIFSRLKRAFLFHSFPEALRPYRASLLLTKKCNLKCLMCSFADPDYYKNRNDLSTDEWITIIDQLYAFGIKDLNFQGGECLLRTDIDELISYAKNNLHAFTTLTTNGILLKKKKKVLENIDRLIVSIDSLLPETHDMIRGRTGLLDMVLENISEIKDIPGRINIASIIHKLNLDNLDLLMDYAVKNGFEISFTPIAEDTVENSARYVENLNPYSDGSNTIQEIKLKRLLRRRYSPTNFKRVQFILDRGNKIKNQQLTNITVRPCNAMNNFLLVMFDGLVYPCCGNMPQTGDLKKDNINTLWNSDSYRKLRRASRKGDHPICRKCMHIETEYLFPEIFEELIARLTGCKGI